MKDEKQRRRGIGTKEGGWLLGWLDRAGAPTTLRGREGDRIEKGADKEKSIIRLGS